MKELIINFFRNDRTFRGAVAIYQQHGQKMALKKRLNAEAETDLLKGILFEELRDMAGISMDHFNALMNTPVSVKRVADPAPADPAPADPAPADLKPAKKSEKSSGKGKGKGAGKGKVTGKNKPAEKKTTPKEGTPPKK